METIGVFLNGSEAAQASLEFGIEEARLRNARLRLISAWEVPQSMLGAGVGGKELFEQFREDAEALVDEGVARVAEVAPSIECERRVVKGQPNSVFLEESQGCTLVVAARRRQGTLRELVIGSVSRHILNHAECPVVVIPILTPQDEKLE
jgi:nucleotide-binding universal stress UspA family protein